MLRNREFRRFAILFLVLAAVSITLGFMINPVAGVLMIASSIAFGSSFFIFTKIRYRSIARISNQIDLILHNTDRLMVEDVEEGELSILYSEITKMTLRIREQNDVLKKERQSFIRELEELLVRMDWLITSLLKLSRVDAGVVEFQKEPVDVWGLIQSALRPLAISLELRGIFHALSRKRCL